MCQNKQIPINNSQVMETIQMPYKWWMDQKNVIHIHMLFEGKWIQLEDIMLSEVSQAQKDKDHMLSLICRRSIQKMNIYPK
jgi:hypothetical protein